MQEPFIGTVILFGGNFPPVGWRTCDGSLLPIDQYSPLFALIGTTYGGDGMTNFAVPDLRSRIPVGESPTYPIGLPAGVEQVTLTGQTMPQHSHTVFSSSAAAGSTDPTNNFLGASAALKEYDPGTSGTSAMIGSAIVPFVGGVPHANIMPYQAMNYIIATDGIFPSRP